VTPFVVESFRRQIEVSNFDQIAPPKERSIVLGRREALRCAMPITDQFWQYAKEAMMLACEAKSDEDKQAFLDLARTWALAAMTERHAEVRHNKPVAVQLAPNAFYLGSVTADTIGLRNEQDGRVSG
jgi:hypothetical protein